MLKQFLIDVRVRLAAVFARRALRDRAEEEVQFHLSMIEQRMIDSGMPSIRVPFGMWTISERGNTPDDRARPAMYSLGQMTTLG